MEKNKSVLLRLCFPYATTDHDILLLISGPPVTSLALIVRDNYFLVKNMIKIPLVEISEINEKGIIKLLIDLNIMMTRVIMNGLIDIGLEEAILLSDRKNKVRRLYKITTNMSIFREFHEKWDDLKLGYLNHLWTDVIFFKPVKIIGIHAENTKTNYAKDIYQVNRFDLGGQYISKLVIAEFL